MDKKNIYNTRELVSDAIFCAIIIVLLLVFSFMAYMSRSVLGIMLASVIGLYYYKKSIYRCIISTFIIFMLMTVFNGVVISVGVYLPNLILGVILSNTFRLNYKSYTSVTLIAFTTVSAAEFILNTLLVSGISLVNAVTTTIEKYSFVNITGINSQVMVLVYVVLFSVIIATMKMIIAYKFKKLFEKKLYRFIK